jgi:hypothetical protein
MDILDLELDTEVTGVKNIDELYREICEEDQY